MRQVFIGAALVVAGIAAFIEAHSHHANAFYAKEYNSLVGGEALERHNATGLSQTVYDLLRIGAWALVIFGGLLIVVGLIGYWGAQRDSRA